MPTKKIAITNKTKQLDIVVTANDIRRGRKLNITRCPIALALRRKYDRTPSVGNWAVGFDGIRSAFYLPPKAVKFVDKFDDGKTVKPFRFRARRQSNANS